ncbi:MAG: hypothetical protein ACRETC_11295 [Gammaproteobacteria bacterium]
MKRRFLALIAILVVIGVLSFFLWRHMHRPVAQATLLYTVTPSAVTAIDARWASGERIALRRGVHGWFLVAPVKAPANATRVNAFLDALGEPVAHRYDVATIPLARAGLAPAYLSLRIGLQQTDFGHTNPASSLRYVRRGQHILMVEDTLVPRLAAGPWQFVSASLLPPGESVQGVQLGSGPVRDSPTLLAAWQHARATRIGPGDASSPSKPVTQVRLRLAHQSHPLVFDILARQPRLQLSRAGSKLIYTLPAAAASRLLPATLPAHARTTGG